MQLLLIEDHPEIWQNIVDYCESEWRTVNWYTSAEDAFDRIGKQYRDCVVLDVMLPGMDGTVFLEYIRRKSQIPVIMSTAKWTIDEKWEAYTLGADDYLVKPYSLAELVMRVQAVVSRSQESDVVTIWNCTIYLDENRVVVDTQDIHLTTKERIILAELVDANAAIVQRTTLIEAVWWDDQTREHDGALDVYIANLRKKLGKSLIETVKGVGYKIWKG
jgi:two-component system response regulator QseB